jgi:transcriptional regulator with XRE-family HTH domain
MSYMRPKPDQALARVLSRLHDKSPLSVEHLAARADLTARAMTAILRGTSSPAFVTVVRVAEALDVPMGRLIKLWEAERG